MKISILVSLLILGVAGIFGWKNQREITEITVTREALVAEAALLGITLDADGSPKLDRSTKRPREDKEAEAREAARDFIAFAKEMEEFKESGEQPDEATQERMMDFVDRMISLDADQLKILIAEFRASTDMEDETRNGMIMFAVMTLASDHPEAALTIFTESEDLIENGMMSKHLLSSSLSNWAATDPDAALEWVRKNSEKHSDLITDDVKAGLVKGAGQNDLRLAFDLIDELKLGNPENAVRDLAISINDPGKRSAFLALVREKAKAIGDESERKEMENSAVSALAHGIAKEGFEEATKWIAANELSGNELDQISGTIGHAAKNSEKGKWIEWMGENLSGDSRDSRIGSIVANWTRQDYRAAGEWLTQAEEGPTKQAAVSSYAETVAKYDPRTAAQWALTLPAGEKRDATLEDVYQRWPEKTPEDKAAREDFKAEHGIR